MNTQETIRLISRALASEATEAEQQQLRDWRAEAVANEQLYNEHRMIWENSTAPDSAVDTDAAWQKFASRMQPAKKALPLTYIMRVAAAIIFIGGGALLVNKLLMGPGWQSVQTAANETRQVVLPDGSVAWLNHDSKLEYEEGFEGDQRSLKLEGEAFFEVVKNPAKQFIITSGSAVTKVLGTSFNINAYKGYGKVTLSVVTGKVSFTATTTSAEKIVVAGQSAVIDEKGENLASDSADLNAVSWKTKKLVFRDAPLSEVLKSISHHFNIKISVGNARIYNCHFTGEFENPELQVVMEALARTLQLQWSKSDRQISVKGKGCD